MISVTMQFAVRGWKEQEVITAWRTQITNRMPAVQQRVIWDSLPLQLWLDFIYSVSKVKKRALYLETSFTVAINSMFTVILIYVLSVKLITAFWIVRKYSFGTYMETDVSHLSYQNTGQQMRACGKSSYFLLIRAGKLRKMHSSSLNNGLHSLKYNHAS